MTIKRKMTILVSTMLISIVLLSIVFIYNESSEILKNEAETYMAAQLDRANENVTLLFKTIVLETDRLSLEHHVVDYFEGTLSQKASDEYLTDLMAEKNAEELLYFDLFLMNHQGIIVSAAMDSAIGVDVGSREYFKKAVRTKETNTSDIILSRADKTQIVITIAPTYNSEGETIGYTGVAIYATYFSNFLNNFNVTKSNDYIIVDSYDHIVSHPNKKLISSRFNYFGLDRERLSKDNTIVYNNETYKILQKDLGFNNWRILSYLKYDDIYAKSMELAYSFMKLGIVAILLTLIFGIYLTDFISRPIVAMTESINRLLEDENQFQKQMFKQLPFDVPEKEVEMTELGAEPTEVSNFRKAIIGFQSALQQGAESFDLEHEKLKHYIDRLYKELEMINRRNLDFIATLSHDIRTPLTLIKGYARGLESGEITDKEMQVKFQKGIVKSVDDIEHLVYNVLDFAYEVDHKAAFEFEHITVGSFLQGASFELTNLYEGLDKQVEYNFRFDSEDHRLIAIDKMNIMRALTNLVNNSLKYTKGDQVIRLSIFAKNEKLYFEVYDEGLGIQENEIAHIFDLFYRTEASKDIKGYGLGLYVSQQILKAHDSTLICQSDYGHYTRMAFELPILGGM
jgi:signal transduction histidine kinase